jgi:hypothetical protein
MQDSFFIKDIDDFIKGLKEITSEYKSKNRELFFSNNKKFQEDLISKLESSLDESTVRYMGSLQLTKTFIRERVLEKYIAQRIGTFKPEDIRIEHSLEGKSKSRINNRIQSKKLPLTEVTLDKFGFANENDIEYLIAQEPYNLIHKFKDHDLSQIEVLSVSNLYELYSKNKSLGFISGRIKRSERETQKIVDWITDIRKKPGVPYDTIGTMEVVPTAKEAYRSIPIILDLRDDADKKLGSSRDAKALPEIYHPRLVNESELEATTSLNNLLNIVRRGDYDEIDLSQKKIPGIFVKRYFGAVPMETQIYTPPWFEMYNKFHNEVLVTSRLNQREEHAKNAGLELVVEYLDTKLKDVFTFKQAA